MAASSSVLGCRRLRTEELPSRSRRRFRRRVAPLRVDLFSFRASRFNFFIMRNTTDKFRRQIAKKCRPQIAQIFADHQTNRKPADDARDLALQNSVKVPDEIPWPSA